jgi:hypothetical protein
LVGGIAGIVSLVLTLYYRNTAHRILLARHQQEEQAREVAACVDDFAASRGCRREQLRFSINDAARGRRTNVRAGFRGRANWRSRAKLA